ncbi:hypothetical protein [Bittarella massiliensis (ex Durand et al. 2017)]|uniref:hypothetical protein n=1 Tax=Bittarella massiliensis (ex Durand et al. 2017) TaxID=1720313 RepID=UPI00073ED876|nr:hypothetical protein [Bittarella massiliensis (ex Durand et al. 2017)]
MTKREFRKKCKREKSTSYQLILSGTIVSLAGLVVVLLTLFTQDTFANQIFGFTIGLTISLVGMGLDIAGEVWLSQEFKKYKGESIADQIDYS